MRVRAICCEIVFREACLVAANSPLVIDFDFLRKGLHNLGAEKMRAGIQEAVDAVDPAKYEATVLGYALCNNGLAGVKATRTKLVIPRAHDCISFFLGSARRYQEYFDSHPGTYFRTSGWSERDLAGDNEGAVHDQLGPSRTYEELVEKYGEDNAKYIFETLGGWKSSYSRLTYIDMGLASDAAHIRRAEEEAQTNGWTFERVEGDWRLLKDLFEGRWDSDEFLVVEPGQTIEPSHDSCILRCGGARGPVRRSLGEGGGTP